MPVKQAQIRIAPGSMEIVSLTITDDPTIQHVAAIAEGERAAAVTNLIQFGARVQQYATDRMGTMDIVSAIQGTTKGVHETLSSITVETHKHIDRALVDVFGVDDRSGSLHKRLDGQLASLQRDLTSRLDPEVASSITARLRKSIADDVKALVGDVRGALDLNDPKSPLAALRRELVERDARINERLGEIAQAQATKIAVAGERKRGTGKGADFEEALETMLTPVCRFRHDVLTNTSTESGATRRKTGDFLMAINPAESGSRTLTIAIEAKNDRSREIDLIRELDAAMLNRGAAFGIAVTTNRSLFPEGSAPLIFPDVNKAIVGVRFVDGEIEDGDYLEAALEAARYVTIALRDRGDLRLDAAALNDLVTKAMTSLKKVTDVRRRISAIATAAREVDTCVVAMRDELNAALAAIRDGLAAQLTVERTDVAA